MKEENKILETGVKIIKEDVVEAQKEWASVAPKKRIAISGIISVVLAIAVIAIFCVVILPTFLSAEEKGREKGQTLGNAVGLATGSLDGVTNGLKEGWDKGKEEGQSAKDTVAEISNAIKAIGNLEVLKTNINYVNVFKTGPDGKEKYARLYEKTGTVKYTVDLSKVSFDPEGDTLIVTIPKPSLELIQDSNTFVRDEWEDPLHKGANADGQRAAENSDKEIEKKIKEEILKDTQLMDAAKEAAYQQIELLVKAMSASTKNVKVVGGDK